jgi:hypothetical protein
MNESQIFIGDIDEYYCDAVDGNKRWAVWNSNGLLGRFYTEEAAENFAKEVQNGMD